MKPNDLRLATLVVYHFDTGLKPLVRLHLERLKANCPPGTLFYGAAIRLSPADTRWLRDEMGVRLPPLPPLPAILRAEHNAALDALAEAAFADGATHVATFHQDSFPFRPDWLDRLFRDMTDQHAFAVAVPRSFNACMVWDRMWQDRQPTMLLPGAVRASADYAQFEQAHADLVLPDGGHGHLFKAWQNGLRWRALEKTGADLDLRAEVLDDAIFHLKAATRLLHGAAGPRHQAPLLRAWRARNWHVLGWMPDGVKAVLRGILGLERKDWAQVTPDGDGSSAQKHAQFRALLDDPDQFIAAARRSTGS